jgi:cytoskeletal protein RodZ
MTIEGLGKKFQEARVARGLTLDEAARLTKIRPSRLAEIEAEDFSQFPSLAYAKGFLLIYGKFLDIDVTPYLEAFEGSENVTIDGYSYLQESAPPKPVRTPVVRRRVSSERRSVTPVVIGAIVLIVGFFLMKLILNIQRIAPRRPPAAQAQAQMSAPPTARAQMPAATAPSAPAAVAPVKGTETNAGKVGSASSVAPSQAATARPAAASPSAAAVAVANRSPAKEPEIRRAEPVRPEDLTKAATATKETSTPAESAGPNRVDIRPLKKTYVKVVIDNETATPAFERWISPADGTVEFRGQHIAVRVLDRDAIQIKKNGKVVTENDDDITVE